MKKQLLAALTAAFCLCSSMPVMAEEAPITGTYEGLDWILEEHVLTVSGNTCIYTDDGAWDGDGREYPDWNEYSEEIYEIVIEEGVTGAYEYALSGYPNLEKISLPSTFTFLFPYALSDNPELAEIEGLEHVEYFNFQCLTGTAYIAEHPFVITDGVLLYAEGTDLNVPEGVTEIAPFAFGNLNSHDNWNVTEGLSEYFTVTLPESVEKIDDFAFALNSGLESINIPENVQYIGDYAFMLCAHLNNLTLGEKVEQVGDMAFFGCKSLDTLTVEGNPSFGTYAYGSGVDWIHAVSEDGIEDVKKRLEEDPLFLDEIMPIYMVHYFYTHPYQKVMNRINVADNLREFPEDLESSEVIITGSITGHTGSDAHRYALYNHIPFRSLEEAPLPGDLNADGSVDLLDVILLNRHLMTGETFTPEQLLAADFNGDGLVNSVDSLAMLRHSIGLE